MELNHKTLRNHNYYETYSVSENPNYGGLEELYAFLWLTVISIKYKGINNYLLETYSKIEKEVITKYNKKVIRSISYDELELIKLEYDDLNSLYKFLYCKTLSSENISKDKRLKRIIDSLMHKYRNSNTNLLKYAWLKDFKKDLNTSLKLMYLISSSKTKEKNKFKELFESDSFVKIEKSLKALGIIDKNGHWIGGPLKRKRDIPIFMSLLVVNGIIVNQKLTTVHNLAKKYFKTDFDYPEMTKLINNYYDQDPKDKDKGSYEILKFIEEIRC